MKADKDSRSEWEKTRQFQQISEVNNLISIDRRQLDRCSNLHNHINDNNHYPSGITPPQKEIASKFMWDKDPIAFRGKTLRPGNMVDTRSMWMHLLTHSVDRNNCSAIKKDFVPRRTVVVAMLPESGGVRLEGRHRETILL